MSIHHVKRQPAASTSVQEKGCLTFDTHLNFNILLGELLMVHFYAEYTAAMEELPKMTHAVFFMIVFTRFSWVIHGSKNPISIEIILYYLPRLEVLTLANSTDHLSR